MPVVGIEGDVRGDGAAVVGEFVKRAACRGAEEDGGIIEADIVDVGIGDAGEHAAIRGGYDPGSQVSGWMSVGGVETTDRGEVCAQVGGLVKELGADEDSFVIDRIDPVGLDELK